MSDRLFIENSCVKIIVRGDVQGVGYRYFIARFALKFEINGYAKNLFSGEVEIMAEGRKEYLNELISKAKEGPPHSSVESVSVEWLDFKNKYSNFDIR